MTIVTIFALFGDDILMLALKETEDELFNYLTLIAAGLFLLEIILGSFAKEGYFLSFYFWLDFAATTSLMFDISWFWESVLGTGRQSSVGG